MGKYARELNDQLIDFIERQAMFFVATAPSDDGRINVSPKGYDSFRIIGPKQVAYLDYAGSGNETANHLKDNGKITFMWCSFGKEPLILRLYAYGNVIAKGSDNYGSWVSRCFPAVNPDMARQIIVADIEAVQTSCGYGVPLMTYEGERPTMRQWGENQLEKGTLDTYIAKNGGRLEHKYPLQPQQFDGSI